MIDPATPLTDEEKREELAFIESLKANDQILGVGDPGIRKTHELFVDLEGVEHVRRIGYQTWRPPLFKEEE